MTVKTSPDASQLSIFQKIIFVMKHSYKDGNVFHFCKRYVRLFFVLLFQWRQFRLFDRQISAHALALHLAPTLLFRPIRPYLYAPLGFEQRALAVIQHFDFLENLFINKAVYTRFMQQIYTGQIELAQWELAGDQLSIRLAASGGLDREGELSLIAYLNNERILSSSFSIVRSDFLATPLPHSAAHIVFIGCLKGHPGQRDAIRAVTKKIHGLRPRTLLILAHQAFLNTWLGSNNVILGVGAKGHFSARYARMQKRVQVNYDEFWLELGSTEIEQGLFLLPTLPQHKPLEEVKSNKRAETLRRREFETDLFDQITAAAHRLLDPARGL